jgi:hypothetical protein
MSGHVRAMDVVAEHPLVLYIVLKHDARKCLAVRQWIAKV